MAKSFFSASWYRVADIKPRLRSHAQIHRQRFRGQTWYVLQDYQSGQFYRLSQAAYRMVCMMDGRRTMREIWERFSGRMGDMDECPTQDEVIRLLTQLHHADLLHGENVPDTSELSERSRKQARRELLKRVANPMAVRIPLFDPERFLALTFPMVAPCFTKVGFVVWLLLVGFGTLLGVQHWDALTNDVFASLFTAQNLFLISITYPGIKILHELGHGYATKKWGGEVHELGVMLLVLFPVPYIDASSSSAFQQKWHRALVAGAGIMTEAALAALAMIFWVLAEPGFARTMAFNVVLIGGVSTLLFNGNPLLRFDGYYVLCDLVEIPNLGSRSNRYLLYLLRRNVLGMRDEESPVTAQGETRWFFVYGIVAYLYRVFVAISIAIFIGTKLFFLGILLAVFTIFQSIGWPVIKGIHYLATNPRIRHHRRRAMLVGVACFGVIFALFLVIPFPYSTLSKGIIQLPSDTLVSPETSGFVGEIVASPGEIVVADMPLIEMYDVELIKKLKIQTRTLEELELRKRVADVNDQTRARLLEEQIKFSRADVAWSQRRVNDLTIRAPKTGRFIIAGGDDLLGRFVAKGEVVAHVVTREDPLIRVVVDQGSVDLVRRRTREVTARRVEDHQNTSSVHVVREVPMAQQFLPNLAFSTHGGGDIISDEGADKPRALESMFSFDLAFADTPDSGFVGTHVYVRFDHGREPLAVRIWRATRQLFLQHFGV